jgi:energy-coupling factor transport system substrate-specific component
LVVAAVLSVAVGVIFWAWGLLWSSAFAAIPFPFSYVLVGVWMIGGLLVPYIIRRRGAALLGELVAAFVSMALGNQWGILTMASGLVHGVGAELVFGLGRWRDFRGVEFRLKSLRFFGKSFSIPLWRAGSGIFLYGAAALAGAFSILLDTFVYSYYRTYSWGNILLAGVLCVIGSVILGGGLSQLLGDALAKTGVLSGLAISKGKVKRI